MGKHARAADKSFWGAASVQKGAERLKKAEPVPLHRRDRHRGDEQARRPSRQRRHERVDHDVDPARRSTTSAAARRTVSPSSRPWARRRRSSGLFGTVWGIVNALTAIGIAGQASIDKVAGPVGEALIMTAIGSRGRGAGRARLQLARAPEQDGDGQRPQLRRRPARGAAERAESRGPGISHVDERRLLERRGRGHLDHQHDAARRCHAGAADHLPDHDSGRHDVGPRRTCRRSATRFARRSRRTSFFRSTRPATSTGTISRSQTTGALIDRLKKISVLVPQPEVQIRGDGRGTYTGVGRIIYAVPARGHRQGRLHHRAAASRRLTPRQANRKGQERWE